MKPYQVSGRNVAKPRDSDALQWSVELQQECSIHIALGHGYPGFESFFGSSIGYDVYVEDREIEVFIPPKISWVILKWLTQHYIH